MESHELLKDVLKRTSAKQIAAEMSLSLSLIYKWAEPPVDASGSGASNPLDRIAQLIKATGEQRIAQWVCEKSGGFFIRNPPAKASGQALVPATNEIVNDFARLLGVIAAASADQQVTAAEARGIRASWEALKSATEGFVQSAERGAFREQGATSTPPSKS
jgi:sensor domain CHASE-containing protein